MKSIEENTVKANNQLLDNDSIRYYGNVDSDYRILIVGNSITRHGYLESIGWLHDYGMAASKEENDYVHVLLKEWNKRNTNYLLCVKQAASFEVMINEHNIDLSKFKEIKDFKADLIIFRLAENISLNIEKEYLKNSVFSFIEFINDKKSPIIFTTSFWKNDIVDDVIKELSELNNNRLVDITDLGENPKMKAYGMFEHSGVQAHPGDLGMKNIALRINNIVKEYLK